MSKQLLLFSTLLLVGTAAYADTDTIELDAGTLKTRNGTALVPLNGLLEIVTNPTGPNATFTAPIPGSFVAGSDLETVRLAMNSTTGETDNVFSITVNSDSTMNSPSSFDVGDPLLLRWFPGFTLVSGNVVRNPAIGGTGPNTLQAGDQYGEFRATVGQLGGISWFAQPGGSYNLNFLTSNLVAGGYDPTVGFANLTVSPVPEPSTYALLGLGLGGLGFTLTQRRRQQQAALGA